MHRIRVVCDREKGEKNMTGKRILVGMLAFLLFLEGGMAEGASVSAMGNLGAETGESEETVKNAAEEREEGADEGEGVDREKSGNETEDGKKDRNETEETEDQEKDEQEYEGVVTDGKEEKEDKEGTEEDRETEDKGEGTGEEKDPDGEGDKDPDNEGEKDPEIMFPEFCLKSAVNDTGNTVTDADGTCYFRESMKVTFQIEDLDEEEKNLSGQFVIRRGGMDLTEEAGCFTDVIDKEGEYVYTIVYTAEDADEIAGENSLTVRGRKIAGEPSVSVIYDSDPAVDSKERYFMEDPKIRVCAGSDVGILMTEYREGTGAYAIWKDFRKEDACYTYGEQTDLEEELRESDVFAELLTDMEDGSFNYTFRVTDVLGGTAEAEMEFTVDKTAPDSRVFVAYASDGTNPASVADTGIMDFVHSITDRLFGKKEVWFDLYVTDGKSEGQGQPVSSGIDTEDLCGQIAAADGKAVIQKLQPAEEGGASFWYDGKQYEDYVHIRGCMRMPSKDGQNITDRLWIKRLKDRAGNVTYGTDQEDMTGTTVIYMDQKPPVLSVDYGEGILDEEKNTVFYTGETALELMLKEENYLSYVRKDGNPVAPCVEFADDGGYGASAREWSLQGPDGNRACTQLLFPAVPGGGEAVYKFTVEYQDGSGNLLETDGVIPGKTENGVYTGCTVVVDDRPPELTSFSIDGETAGQCDGMDVYHNTEGDDVKVSFEIDDHPEYWNPEAVRLAIWDLDTREEAAAVSGSSLQWKENGRSHLAEYAFDGEEGKVSRFRVTVFYEDRAGNRMVGRGALNDRTEEGVYTSRGLILDHKAPDFQINYNDAVRLVRDSDADPSQDIRDAGPQTGYTAYYGSIIEVFFSIREQCGRPVYKGGDLAGLQGFKLTVTGRGGNAYSPAVHWNKTGDFYEGRFSLTEEDRYTVFAQYRDLAGNAMVSGTVDGSRWESGLLEDGSYESVPLVLDKTAPALRISYADTAKNDKKEEAVYEEDGCRFFSEPVYLKLEAEDENLRFHEMLQQLCRIRVADRLGNGIPDNSAGAFLEKLDKDRIVEDGIVWYLPLMTEAVYEIPFGCEDLSGNSAELIVERVCVDETEPETELSYSVEKSGFLDVVRYGDLRYLFADGRLTIRADAKDQVSGIRSIRCTAEEGGKRSERTMDFLPAASGSFEITIPSGSSDFKGTVTAEVWDWSGNRTVQKCGSVVEGDGRHGQDGSAVILTDTSPSRTVGGVDYYNTDIRFRLMVRDMYSGLKSVACKGGNTLDYYREYGTGDDPVSEAAEGIVYECQEELVLDAVSNNENEVPVRADYQDHTGHTGMAEQFYNIDITAPVIEVEYDNQDRSDHGLYRQGRTATVTIRERNFDPADVEFVITSTDGTMPSIGGWQESGAGDDMLHVCHVDFYADGEYTFTLRFTDLAGNQAEYGQVDEFTIDRTAPVVTVKFDQEREGGNEYFARGRTAVVDILEHNFDASLVQLMITEKNGIPVPALSGWRRDGDHNMATIRFDADGDYTFGITGTDQAGNQMNEYGTEHFIIDQTAPVLEISGLEDRSANKGAVSPVIRCMDANYRKGSMKIELTGCQGGWTEWKGERIENAEGESFLAEDLAYLPEVDDLYLLLVSVSDLAGNVSRKEIRFSVNRFGSVYTLEDKTELLAGSRGTYYTNTEQDIIVTETNVDTLEFLEISCSRNGKLLTLKQNEDYYVHTGGTEDSWKQYVYTIPGRNFTEEGTYILTIYSEDRAENVSDNQTKGKKIEFVMDRTAPSILLSGLENGGQYRENSREITLDIQDNVRMAEVKVKINGVVSTYSASEILKQDGRLTLMAGSANRWQTLSVTACDAAGNQKELEELRFLLTPDLMVQFFMDRSLLFCSMGGLILVWTGAWRLFLRRKRFRKCKERVQ